MTASFKHPRGKTEEAVPPSRGKALGVVLGAGRALIVSVSLAWLVAGCVAVPVGKPAVYPCDLTREETGAKPERTTMEKARVYLRQCGSTVNVSIDAELGEDYARWRHVRHVTVRRQKRLAFGLFPGAAELVWMPEGALASAQTVARVDYDPFPQYCGYYGDRSPGLGQYAQDQWLCLFTGILPVLFTCESLLVAPFEPWGCSSHDYIDADCWERGVSRKGRLVADASASPRIRALAELPEDLRREIGVRTCFDVRSTGSGGGFHLGWVGFHKYLAVFVEVEVSKELAGEESRRKKIEVEGPCEIELAIPGIGHSEKRIMMRGETSVAFDLPPVAHETAIEARVTVREVPWKESGGTPEWTREAIRKLTGQANRFDVNLRAGSGARGGESFEIAGIRATREGRYEVRVRVADASRRDAVAAAIAPEVRRRIREDYANRHPAARVGEIRDWVAWKAAEDDSSILVFDGWAFSASPLPEGWTYEEKTRRGEIRVSVPENLPQEQAEQWARENVGILAADKAVALESGKGPPKGAKFRCIGAQCANGILSVGFEVFE